MWEIIIYFRVKSEKVTIKKDCHFMIFRNDFLILTKKSIMTSGTWSELGSPLFFFPPLVILKWRKLPLCKGPLKCPQVDLVEKNWNVVCTFCTWTWYRDRWTELVLLVVFSISFKKKNAEWKTWEDKHSLNPLDQACCLSDTAGPQFRKAWAMLSQLQFTRVRVKCELCCQLVLVKYAVVWIMWTPT